MEKMVIYHNPSSTKTQLLILSIGIITKSALGLKAEPVLVALPRTYSALPWDVYTREGSRQKLAQGTYSLCHWSNCYQ
jgi:hypothetical protein